MKKCGFTLLELLIVIIIIGVLAVLMFPGFRPARESALNNEARANLKLIQAAERIRRLESGAYYFNASESEINTNLKISLPTQPPLIWDYNITINGSNFNAIATRNATAPYDRTWWINSTLEEPLCTGTFCK